MIRKTSQVLPGFEYFIKGDNPKILLHAGTHGNEYESIDFVTECIKKYENLLPNFIYVPKVSPSAVKLKTRKNKNGLDLNRAFFDNENDVEVRVNISILQKFKFDLMITFHEDPEKDEYYLYDEGYTFPLYTKIVKYHEKLSQMGIKLLNGIDDPYDPHLNFKFLNGYRQFKFSKEFKNNGSITGWLLSQKRVNDTLTVEVPGKGNLKIKDEIIDSFFINVLMGKTTTSSRI